MKLNSFIPIAIVICLSACNQTSKNSDKKAMVPKSDSALSKESISQQNMNEKLIKELSCIKMFGGVYNGFILRNTCDGCMTAVIKWQPSNKNTEYKIQGHSDITVTMIDQTAMLIDEFSCR